MSFPSAGILEDFYGVEIKYQESDVRLELTLRANARQPDSESDSSSSSPGPTAQNSKAAGLNWLFEVIHEGAEAEPTVAQLSKYVRGVNALIESGSGRPGGFDLLDTALAELNPKNISTRTAVTLARALAPIGPHLVHWRPFVSTVCDEINARGKDGVTVLRGLL